MSSIPTKVIQTLVEKVNKDVESHWKALPDSPCVAFSRTNNDGSWRLNISAYPDKRFYHLYHYSTWIVTVMVGPDDHRSWDLSDYCKDNGVSVRDQQGINSLLKILGIEASVSRAGKTRKCRRV